MRTQPLPNLPSPPESPLLIQLDDASSQPFRLKNFNVLGRDPDCHVHFADSTVSQRHARIIERNGRFFIIDLKSRNGTRVNGLCIGEAELSNHDVIELGQSRLLFIAEQDYCAQAIHNPALKSKNPELQNQLSRLPALAKAQLNVMLLGPSGAGKELIAQAIHQLSPRSQGPFVALNCSGLSEGLVESELFGHRRGSFTGATQDHKGAFAQAHRGTLFLDEIGDLPLAIQPKLLRALDNQEIRPLGSESAQKVDTRIVCATHKSLLKLVHLGQFRLDLYYRLNASEICLPPLKDRREDFETLLYGFAREYRVSFSYSAIEELKKHSWPGNIRELKNTVAKAAALFERRRVEAEDIAALIIASPQPGKIEEGNEKYTWNNIQRKMIERQLLLCQGNQRKAAMELGIPKSTLHDKIKYYNIDLEEIKRLGPMAWL